MNNNSASTKILIILLVLLFVAVAVMGSFYIKIKQKVDLQGDVIVGENTLLLDEFVMNLKSEESGPNYLKAKIALMYPDSKDEKKINENISKVRDIVNREMRVKSADEILDVKKMETFKAHLIKEINQGLGKEAIYDIYFTDLVIQ